MPQDYKPWGEVDKEDPAAPGGWWADCSSSCRHYLVLADVGEERLSFDGAVCTNPRSHRHGLLKFFAMARSRPPDGRIGPRSLICREPEGWTVRVTRQGRIFSDYFGDAVWGGRELALLAARHFRDRLLTRLEPDTRVRRRVPRGRPSTTEIVGVRLETYEVGGRVYQRYVASWEDVDEGTCRRRFSVALYGKERALELAIEAREQGVARSRARLMARQREEARRRLVQAGPMPRPVKDPRSRKGISMARRRPRA